MTSLRTHWTYWVVALAAHKLGLILSPVYYRLTQKDFVYRTQKAAARCIVTCQESRETLLAVAEETGVRLRFSIGGGEGFEDLLAAIAPQPTTMDRVETRWDDPSCSTSPPAPRESPKACSTTTPIPWQTTGGPVYAGYSRGLPPLCYRGHRLGGGLGHQVLRPVAPSGRLAGL